MHNNCKELCWIMPQVRRTELRTYRIKGIGRWQRRRDVVSATIQFAQFCSLTIDAMLLLRKFMIILYPNIKAISFNFSLISYRHVPSASRLTLSFQYFCLCFLHNWDTLLASEIWDILLWFIDIVKGIKMCVVAFVSKCVCVFVCVC